MPCRFFLIFLLSVFPLCLASAAGRGHVNLEGLSFLQDQPDPVANFEGRIQAEYDQKFKFSKTLSFRFHPFVQATSLPDAWQDAVFFDPREMAFEYKKTGSFIRAGFVTLRWEGTDGLNPMDIASMKNWGDPLEIQTKASAGIQAGKSTQNFDFEAVWIPRQTKSELPGEKSAWLPRQAKFPLRNDNVDLLLPGHTEYRYGTRRELDHAFDNNYGARLQFHGDLGDLAFAYFEGAADAPLVSPELLNLTPISLDPGHQIYQLVSPVTLAQTDYRRRTVAGFASATLGEWIFRIASRYDQPLESAKNVTGWSQQTVGGFERGVELFGETVTFVAQGCLMHVPQSATLISIQDVFDRSVLLGARVPIHEVWTILLGGLYSTQDKSSFVSSEITRSLGDAWTLKLNLQFLQGPSNTLLSILDKNDRASLTLTRSF